MNLTQLKYIVEVEKTGSISRAAANLNMNQPHLSKSIRELEDSLGVTLFYRSSRGVIPTEQGTKVLEYAKKILSQADEIEKICRSGAVSKVLLSLAAPRASYVSCALTEFVKNLDPAVPVSVDYRETNSMDTVSLVAQQRDNLGIIRFRTEQEQYFKNLVSSYGLCMEPIWEFEYLVLISCRSPYADSDCLTSSQLSGCIEIAHGDANGNLRNNYGDEWEISNSKISVYERASQFELLGAARNTYMWVSPIPKYMTDKLGLVQKKFALPRGTYKDALIFRDDYILTETDKKFVAILKNTVRELQLSN
ncbi:MAG: LysR family transcriptional regulator [Clostridia bacterium]